MAMEGGRFSDGLGGKDLSLGNSLFYFHLPLRSQWVKGLLSRGERGGRGKGGRFPVFMSSGPGACAGRRAAYRPVRPSGPYHGNEVYRTPGMREFGQRRHYREEVSGEMPTVSHQCANRCPPNYRGRRSQ